MKQCNAKTYITTSTTQYERSRVRHQAHCTFPPSFRQVQFFPLFLAYPTDNFDHVDIFEIEEGVEKTNRRRFDLETT